MIHFVHSIGKNEVQYTTLKTKKLNGKKNLENLSIKRAVCLVDGTLLNWGRGGIEALSGLLICGLSSWITHYTVKLSFNNTTFKNTVIPIWLNKLQLSKACSDKKDYCLSNKVKIFLLTYSLSNLHPFFNIAFGRYLISLWTTISTCCGTYLHC